MDTAIAIVTTVFDKCIDRFSRRRRGPKGYNFVLVVRLLVYAILARYFTTRSLFAHLRARPEVWQRIGFRRCPSRASINRWKRRFRREFKACIKLLGDKYLTSSQSIWTLLDSTPLADEKDKQGKWGKTTRGWFKGFKLHLGCDEKSVPVRAEFTTGNVHDSTPAAKLLAETPCTGADSAYESERLRQKARRKGSVPQFANNPRRKGTAAKQPSHLALRRARSAVERCNNLIKNELLQKCWTKVKGFSSKAALALASVLALQAIALYTLFTTGTVSLKINDIRR